MLCTVKSCANISSNKRCGRILTAKEKYRAREQNYVNLQKRIKKLLDEDDNTFGERLNKLAHDDKFRNNNFEKQSFTPLDADHNNHDNSDPFKFCNNLEEFFDELKSKNDNRAKIIDDLKRHNSCALIPNEEVKHIDDYEREQHDEIEGYDSLKLDHDYCYEDSIQSYKYKELGKPKSMSIMRAVENDADSILKVLDSTFEKEVLRYIKIKTQQKDPYSYRRRDKTGNLLSYLNKNRIFMPFLLVPIATILGALILTTGPIGTALIALTSTMTVVTPVVFGSICSNFLFMGLMEKYYVHKFKKLSSRMIAYRRTSPKIKFFED
ncbi:hypothetical protein PVC01_140005900 [Plasmodium vivax]|uniref:Pv-fam-d protein n=1 Tax=Plasmodium vivax TaxID=5855 RepID=A0A1G4HJP8_PLAVI|nr:hypothetical protein PVC01_140005900 [Plasmodium vivax]